MIITLIVFLVSLGGCTSSPPQDLEKAEMKELDKENIKDEDEQEKISEKDSKKELIDKIEKLEKENKKLNEKITTINNKGHPSNLLAESLKIMNYIKTKNFQDLSGYVHPRKGVRFSPYFFVDEESHKTFKAKEIAALSQNSDIINWGPQDGRGESIELSFSDYYDRYIYDKDYLNPHLVGVDRALGKNEVEDNISDIYKDGKYIDYHFTGSDEEDDGMGGRSLRLVFEKDGGAWYLVGVIHGESTI